MAEAEPLASPQLELMAELDTVSRAGCETFVEAVLMQPFRSVTVTVYVPLVKPDAVALVPPEGAHEYE